MARVILISDSATMNTGYGVATFGLAKYLRRLGHDIAFVGMQHGGAPVYVKLDSEYVPMYEGNNLFSIERAFVDWKPDVGVHTRDAFAHIPKFFPNPYSFNGMQGRPKIALWVPVQAPNYPPEYAAACVNECDFAVAFTEWGKDELQFQGVPFNRIDYAHLGVDTEVIHPRDDLAHDALKQAFGFSGDKPLLGSIGINDQPRKGWPILLEAAGKLKVDLELYLHTPPEGHYALPYHEAHYGLKGKVTYPQKLSKSWGPKPETMAELLCALDVYANASIEEGFNLPLIEAAASGTPVVCTDMPVHREILGNFGNYVKSTLSYPTGWGFGWLADPDEMAKVLSDVLSILPEWRKEARDAQVKWMVERYAWPVIAEKWQTIFKRMGLNV